MNWALQREVASAFGIAGVQYSTVSKRPFGLNEVLCRYWHRYRSSCPMHCSWRCRLPWHFDQKPDRAKFCTVGLIFHSLADRWCPAAKQFVYRHDWLYFPNAFRQQSIWVADGLTWQTGACRLKVTGKQVLVGTSAVRTLLFIIGTDHHLRNQTIETGVCSKLADGFIGVDSFLWDECGYVSQEIDVFLLTSFI